MHLNVINGILSAPKTRQNRKSLKASKEAETFLISAEAGRLTYYTVSSQLSSGSPTVRAGSAIHCRI